MQLPPLRVNEFDRLMFFELARTTAETAHAKNPLDADNLTRWGGALLELCQFQNVADSKKMIQGSKNELYRKSLEVSAKFKEEENSDLKYNIFVWIILSVGIVTWLGFAKSHVPPPPPR